LLKAHIEHTWEFHRCAKTNRPYLQGHTVDLFEYEAGFRHDDVQEYDPHLDAKWRTH
jgi:hypothetical protein